VQPHSQIITQRAPCALRGERLRSALEELGESAVVSVRGAITELPPLAPPAAFVAEVDLGPPPSTAPPRALTGDELQRTLDALNAGTPE
jgi:hypothetical protein